jgi:hypothetical protein
VVAKCAGEHRLVLCQLQFRLQFCSTVEPPYRCVSIYLIAQTFERLRMHNFHEPQISDFRKQAYLSYNLGPQSFSSYLTSQSIPSLFIFSVITFPTTLVDSPLLEQQCPRKKIVNRLRIPQQYKSRSRCPDARASSGCPKMPSPSHLSALFSSHKIKHPDFSTSRNCGHE